MRKVRNIHRVDDRCVRDSPQHPEVFGPLVMDRGRAGDAGREGQADPRVFAGAHADDHLVETAARGVAAERGRNRNETGLRQTAATPTWFVRPCRLRHIGREGPWCLVEIAIVRQVRAHHDDISATPAQIVADIVKSRRYLLAIFSLRSMSGRPSHRRSHQAPANPLKTVFPMAEPLVWCSRAARRLSALMGPLFLFAVEMIPGIHHVGHAVQQFVLGNHVVRLEHRPGKHELPREGEALSLIAAMLMF